uniref:Uncharacterized protein n=1 Tax=Anguilla anguilla TaxID=7936 RepID=A0A0E9X3S2_ANGAN
MHCLWHLLNYQCESCLIIEVGKLILIVQCTLVTPVHIACNRKPETSQQKSFFNV